MFRNCRMASFLLIISISFGFAAFGDTPKPGDPKPASPATPPVEEPLVDPAAEACIEQPEEPGASYPRIVYECMTREAKGDWDEFFPSSTLDNRKLTHNMLACWYGCSLRAMGEPSLQPQKNPPGKHAYRFLWMRSQDSPVAVRLTIAKDGAGTLEVRITSGVGKGYPGSLVNQESKKLTKAEVDGWLAKLSAANFWILPSFQRAAGDGGAQWIVEGLRDGQYQVVDRWSPPEGPIRDLGLEMLRLTGRTFDKVY